MKEAMPIDSDHVFNSLKQYCSSFPDTTEEYPFGPTPLVVKVAGKMFALISPAENNPSISLKCDPFIGEVLRSQYAAVKPGYHLNKRHWITVEVDGTVPAEELREMIASSYQLVVKKLPKAQQTKLTEKIEKI